MENNRGTIKTKITEFEISDYETANIIVNALLEKGYDLISQPLLDSSNFKFGEKITVYKIMQR